MPNYLIKKEEMKRYQMTEGVLQSVEEPGLKMIWAHEVFRFGFFTKL
jgi:hypothetical protein